MKIIVLTAGRSGSYTLYKALKHVRNFTVGHDSGEGKIAAERCVVPANHIEIDTRMHWFLGRLGQLETPDTQYVHLTRNQQAVAKSYNSRWYNAKGIMQGYCQSILQLDKTADNFEIALDMVQTVDANIEQFLHGRSFHRISLESFDVDVPVFLEKIGADVDIDKVLGEFSMKNNATKKPSRLKLARYKVSIALDKLEGLLRRRK